MGLGYQVQTHHTIITMRTKQEIDAEIKALRALRPTGRFSVATAEKISLAIEELEYGFDMTSGEWEELDSALQDIVSEARLWKEGDSDRRPSGGWGGLVE